MILFIRALVSLLVNSTNCSSCLCFVGCHCQKKNKRNLFRPFLFGWLAGLAGWLAPELVGTWFAARTITTGRHPLLLYLCVETKKIKNNKQTGKTLALVISYFVGIDSPQFVNTVPATPFAPLAGRTGGSWENVTTDSEFLSNGL